VLVFEVPAGYITGHCYFVHCLYLLIYKEVSRYLNSALCGVYVELPVILDVSFECYFFLSASKFEVCLKMFSYFG